MYIAHGFEHGKEPAILRIINKRLDRSAGKKIFLVRLKVCLKFYNISGFACRNLRGIQIEYNLNSIRKESVHIYIFDIRIGLSDTVQSVLYRPIFIILATESDILIYPVRIDKI